MERSEGRSPEFQELQLKDCVYRQLQKCAGLNKQRLLHHGRGELKINQPKLAQARAAHRRHEVASADTATGRDLYVYK